MPGLVVFGRRWRVGSDDLWFFSLSFCAVRFAWFCVLCAFLSYAADSLVDCDERGPVFTILALLLSSAAASVLLEGYIALVSRRGSPLETAKRRGAAPALVWHAASSAVEAAAALALGWLAWAPNERSGACVSELRSAPGGRIMLQCVSVFNFFWLVVFFLLAVLSFDAQGSAAMRQQRREVLKRVYSSSDESSETDIELPLFHRDSVADANKWERRCELLCCCFRAGTCNLFGGGSSDRNAFSALARLLSQFMGALDVVPTDIAAGLLLLRAEQRAASRRTIADRVALRVAAGESSLARELSMLRDEGLRSPRLRVSTRAQAHADAAPLDLSAFSEDAEALRLVAKAAPHAVGAYGWMLRAYMRPLAAPCAVAGDGACLRGRARRFEGDTACNAHAHGFLSATKLEMRDLKFANFVEITNKRVPYCVALDRGAGALVLSCRGTITLDDCMTDATAEAMQLDAFGREFAFDGDGRFAHGGMATVAATIARELDAAQTLDALLGPGGEAHGLPLLITGHSLGAGVAALLALFLQSRHPNLRCVALSPPGGLVDGRTAEELEALVTSVVVGEDLVPRLSIRSLFAMRDSVVDCVCRAKASKVAIFATAPQRFPDLRRLFRGDEGELRAARELSEAFLGRMREGEAAREAAPPLVLPGRVLHYAVDEVDARDACCGCGRTRRYEALWTPREAFAEIVLSQRMLFDHLPDLVCDVVGAYAREHGAGGGGGGGGEGAPVAARV